MDEDVVVGSVLRSLRANRGLTLSNVAGATGLSYENIGRWERAVSRPSFERVGDLLRHYGVTWAEFGAHMDAAAAGDAVEAPEAAFLARTRKKISQDPAMREFYERITSEYDARICRLEKTVYRDS